MSDRASVEWPKVAPWAVIAGLPVLLLTLLLHRAMWNNDIAFDLRFGRLVWHDGPVAASRVPLETLQSGPWIDQQWLAHGVIYGIWAIGGAVLVALVLALFAPCALGLVTARGYMRGGDIRHSAGVALLAGIPIVLFAQFRAQTLCFVLLPALLWILDGAEHDPRRWMAALGVLVLWANLHGSLLIGVMVLSITALSRAWTFRKDRRTATLAILAAALAPAAALATPFGTGMISYLSDTAFNPQFGNLIAEWGPLAPTGIDWAIIAALAWLAWRVMRCRPAPHEALIAVILTVEASLHARIAVWALLYMALVVAAHPRLARETPKFSAWWLITAGMMSTACAGLATWVILSGTVGLTGHALPAATRDLDRVCPAFARILPDDGVSEYLLWVMPQRSGYLAADGRLETMGAGLKEYALLLSGGAYLRKRAVEWDAAVIDAQTRVREARTFESLPGWTVHDFGGLLVATRIGGSCNTKS